MIYRITRLILVLLAINATVNAQNQDTLSITLENVKYAYPTKYFTINTEGQQLKMAYMDVSAKNVGNGKTVMLFHGKNFGGYYRTNVINCLQLLASG